MDRRNFLTGATIASTAALTPSCFSPEGGNGVSVVDEGAEPNTQKDATALINQALKDHGSAFVPDGTYRIDGTIKIQANQSLTLAHNAVLQRNKQAKGNTDPVLMLLGRRSRFSGGRIVTENPHPKGIVVLGHESDQKSVGYNANDWYFGHCTLRGVNAKNNIGIWIPNSQDQRKPDVSASNYFGFVEDVTVIGADIGLQLSEVANAHRLIGLVFWNIGSAAFELIGAYGNQIIGGFLHRSTNGVVGIRLKSSRTGNYHPSMQNSFIGFGVEPGGRRSSGFKIDKDCRLNTLLLQDNTTSPGQDENGSNYIMTKGQALLIPTARIKNLEVGDPTAKSRQNLKVNGQLLARDGLGVGNSDKASSAGKIVRSIEVFDAQGRSLGYVPVYDSIR